MSAFPNPANDQLSIKSDDSKAITATMMDMLGRIVRHSQNENGSTVIDVQSLAEGLYLVNITVDGKEMNTKVNIQH